MPNDTMRIGIITGRERWRCYSAEHKQRLVEETMQPGMTVAVSRARRLEQRVCKLERLLGRKTLEVDWMP